MQPLAPRRYNDLHKSDLTAIGPSRPLFHEIIRFFSARAISAHWPTERRLLTVGDRPHGEEALVLDGVELQPGGLSQAPARVIQAWALRLF